MRKGDHLEDPRIYGRIILKYIFEKCDGSINWIDVVQDREKWWAFVTVAMSLRVP